MGSMEALDRSKSKRPIQIIFVLFVVILLFFTLYSNTLQSLSYPKVRAERVEFGSIEHVLGGISTVRPITEAKLTNPAGWKVTVIHVKEGARVKKGQTLVTYDSKSAERELDDELAQLAKQEIDLQNSQEAYIVSATDGDETKLRNAKRDIEMRKLDLGVQERKIAALRANLASNQRMTAPFDGVVTKVNAVVGMTSGGDADVYLANTLQGYRLEFLVDASLISSLGIGVQEKIPVTVQLDSGQKKLGMEGSVYEIVDAPPRVDAETSESGKPIAQKVVRVKLMDAGLKGGEQAEIKLTRQSEQQGFLVASEAVHQDRDGKYIYRIEEKKGSLGNEFIVRKAKIQSSESNDKMTMIVSNTFNMDDLVILESSEPLLDGNRVRLK
ncbi:efflux RND transporter periplasmic adaptor subunit [Paenibacillus guangzhouensis]|uniref:efflux RND transporter periplasmic adaptor subunit n=1 Tax=Paenibacillus guangzhouensis TaxID=1473112 RepID=UPI0012676E96|nr:efflux RND transporter periplasmic adaptor subunit [Paenibacillus guangzhouensis]